jgi:hypothetical protein
MIMRMISGFMSSSCVVLADNLHIRAKADTPASGRCPISGFGLL